MSYHCLFLFLDRFHRVGIQVCVLSCVTGMKVMLPPLDLNVLMTC
jgi:hypothetical protein